MDPQFSTRLLETVRIATNDPGATNERTLLAAFNAIVQGDLKAFGDLLTDDVELDIRGSGMFDGVWRGREEVVKAAALNYGGLAEQKPQIEEMIAQGDTIAVLVEETGMSKADQSSYRVRGVQWFNFSSGKIKRIHEILVRL